VASWVTLHKEVRPLVATGRLVRVDHPDPALVVTGLVSSDAGEAWFVVAAVDTVVTQSAGVVRLPGLEPDRRYAVVDRTPPGAAHRAEIGDTWIDGSGLEMTGRALDAVGVRLPALAPESARVVHLREVPLAAGRSGT
jgi:alpha-galactosidase